MGIGKALFTHVLELTEDIIVITVNSSPYAQKFIGSWALKGWMQNRWRMESDMSPMIFTRNLR